MRSLSVHIRSAERLKKTFITSNYKSNGSSPAPLKSEKVKVGRTGNRNKFKSNARAEYGVKEWKVSV